MTYWKYLQFQRGGGNNLTFSTQTATEGQVVTVTVATVANKRFKKLESDVEGVTFTEVTPNKIYTFVMPKQNIVVTAVYSSLYSVVNYVSYDENISTLSCEIGTQYEEGETVTLTFACATGSETMVQSEIDDYFVHINDLVIKPTYDNGLKATFVMPSADIDIVVIKNPMTEDAENGAKIVCEGDANYVKFYGFDSNKKYSLSFNCIYFTIKQDYNFIVEYKVDNGQWLSGAAIPYGSEYENLYYVFVSAATESFSLRISEAKSNTITWVNAEEIVYGNDGEKLPTSFVTGAEISLEKITLLDNTKYISSVSGKDAEGNDLHLRSSLGDKLSPSEIKFQMPNMDITITFEIKDKRRVTVAENSNISSYSIRKDRNKEENETYFIPNDMVYIGYTCISGYKVLKAQIGSDSENTVEPTSYDFYFDGPSISFKMPDEDVVVTFIGGQTHSISYESEDDVMVQVANSAVVGTKVEGYLMTFNPLCTITGIKEKNHEDLDITYVEGEYPAFSFIMPEYDVVLVPIVEKIAYQTITLKEVNDQDINKITISGSDSDGQISFRKDIESNTMSSEFLYNEELTIRINVNGSTKQPIVKFIGSDGQQEMTPDYSYPSEVENETTFSFFNSITLPEGTTEIEITLVEKTAS